MNQLTADPYATLGIPRHATRQEVARAYRRLAKRYHPDLHADAGASEQMRRVNQAWEVLSSPIKRARYDADSAARGSPTRGHWSGGRPAPVRPTPTPWSSPQPAYAYPRTGAGAFDDADGPSWIGVVATAIIGVVAIVAVFAGLLPFPLLGIALLLVARGIFDRFDGGGR
jgi:hypothetical protein